MEKTKINYSTNPARAKMCTLKFNEGKCTQVLFADGAVINADEMRRIVNAMDEGEKKLSQDLKPVVVNNLPAVKMNFKQAAAFVFKGKEGTILDRLGKIKELAQAEMKTDEEKQAADAVVNGLKKLFEK